MEVSSNTLTYINLHGRYRNQIDHVMVDGRYRRSVCDIRVMCGADVNSDHNLVKVKLELCRNTKP